MYLVIIMVSLTASSSFSSFFHRLLRLSAMFVLTILILLSRGPQEFSCSKVEPSHGFCRYTYLFSHTLNYYIGAFSPPPPYFAELLTNASMKCGLSISRSIHLPIYALSIYLSIYHCPIFLSVICSHRCGGSNWPEVIKILSSPV